MYTIILTDIVTNDETEVCNTDCLDAVETIINNLTYALPHYLVADFKEMAE